MEKLTFSKNQVAMDTNTKDDNSNTNNDIFKILLSCMSSDTELLDRVRQKLLENRGMIYYRQDKVAKIVKSLCLNSTVGGLLDIIIIMNSLNVKIKFEGFYSLLNFFRVKNEFKNLIVLKYENSAFTVEYAMMNLKVCALLPAAFERQLNILANNIINVFNVSTFNIMSDYETEFSKVSGKWNFKDEFLTAKDYNNFPQNDKCIVNPEHENISHELKFQYDVDALLGTLNYHQLMGFKRSFEIKYSINKAGKNIKSKMSLLHNLTFFRVSELVHIHLGKMALGEDHYMNFFLVFPYHYNSFTSKKAGSDKLEIFNILNRFLDKCSNALNSGFKVKTFKKSADLITCVLSQNLMAELCELIKEELKAKDMIIYFESFNTKDIYFGSSCEAVFKLVSEVMDLSVVRPLIDICATLMHYSMDTECLFLNKDFLREECGIKKFNMLCNSNTCSYNGSTFTNRPSMNSKYTQKIGGITKINFYNPVMTTYLNRDLRSMGFPHLASSLLFNSVENFVITDKILKKQKKYIKDLNDVKNSLTQGYIKNIGIRLEIRTAVHNLPFFEDFVDKLCSSSSFIKVKTDDVKQVLLKCVNVLLNMQSEVRNFNSVARGALFETAFFEYFIRGGKNRHIIPECLKLEVIEKFTNFGEKLNEFNTLKINEDEERIIINKLIKYTKSVGINHKQTVSEFFNFCCMNDLYAKKLRLTKSFFKDVCKLYKKPYTNSASLQVLSKKSTDSLTFTDFFNYFFMNASKQLKSCMYYGMFTNISHSIEGKDSFYDFLRKYMILNKINMFYVKDANYRTVVKTILFNKQLTNAEINFMKKYIREHVSNEGMRNTKRAQFFSASEKLLLRVLEHQHTVNPSVYPLKSIVEISKDFNLPFVYYCDRVRIEQGNKTKNNYFQIDRDEFENAVLNVRLENLSLSKIIEFLNINSRRVLDVKTLEYIDTLLNLKNIEKAFEKKSRLYEFLFINQSIDTNRSNDFEFLVFERNDDIIETTTVVDSFLAEDEAIVEQEDLDAQIQSSFELTVPIPHQVYIVENCVNDNSTASEEVLIVRQKKLKLSAPKKNPVINLPRKMDVNVSCPKEKKYESIYEQDSSTNDVIIISNSCLNTNHNQDVCDVIEIFDAPVDDDICLSASSCVQIVAIKDQRSQYAAVDAIIKDYNEKNKIEFLYAEWMRGNEILKKQVKLLGSSSSNKEKVKIEAKNTYSSIGKEITHLSEFDMRVYLSLKDLTKENEAFVTNKKNNNKSCWNLRCNYFRYLGSLCNLKALNYIDFDEKMLKEKVFDIKFVDHHN